MLSYTNILQYLHQCLKLVFHSLQCTERKKKDAAQQEKKTPEKSTRSNPLEQIKNSGKLTKRARLFPRFRRCPARNSAPPRKHKSGHVQPFQLGSATLHLSDVHTLRTDETTGMRLQASDPDQDILAQAKRAIAAHHDKQAHAPCLDRRRKAKPSITSCGHGWSRRLWASHPATTRATVEHHTVCLTRP